MTRQRTEEILEFLEIVLSVLSVQRLCNEEQLVLVMSVIRGHEKGLKRLGI